MPFDVNRAVMLGIGRTQFGPSWLVLGVHLESANRQIFVIHDRFAKAWPLRTDNMQDHLHSYMDLRLGRGLLSYPARNFSLMIFRSKLAASLGEEKTSFFSWSTCAGRGRRLLIWARPHRLITIFPRRSIFQIFQLKHDWLSRLTPIKKKVFILLLTTNF